MLEIRQKGTDEMFCPSCGNVIKIAAEICPHCGVRNQSEHKSSGIKSNSRWTITLILAILLGSFGAHRFYVGKIGTGFLMLLTLGGFGIVTLIDIIKIATGNFRDKQGNLIANQ